MGGYGGEMDKRNPLRPLKGELSRENNYESDFAF